MLRSVLLVLAACDAGLAADDPIPITPIDKCIAEPREAHVRGSVDATLDHGKVTVELRDGARVLQRYRFAAPRDATGIADVRWWDTNETHISVHYATTAACSAIAVPVLKDLPTS